MKILFVLENYLPHIGGVEVVFKNLTEGLVKLGHDVKVVTHQIKGTKKFEIIHGVKVYRVLCLESRYLFTFFSLPKVLKLARKSDIIHTTTFNGAPPAWLASKITKKPVLITVHEVWVGKWRKLTEMGWLKSKIHDFLERMIYFLNYDFYVCVSKSTRKQLTKLGIEKSKSAVVYNGVDYGHWDPSKYDGEMVRNKLDLKGKFVYLFYGRPGISKGLEYLIRAVPLISKKVPNAILLAIVSRDKAYEVRYKQMVGLIKRLGVEDKVIVHEPVSYKVLPAYVKAADCVVVPSLAEGFGFTVAESCAMSKPVVASNTTSLPEVVGGKSVLVRPKDSHAIFQGVLKVHQGRLAERNMNQFYLSDNIRKYERVYNQLLGGL